MRKWKLVSSIFLASLMSSYVCAQSPAGNWTTVDDHTGEKRAIIKIQESGDMLTATVVGVYPKKGDVKMCEKCPGNFKDKPIMGLQFAWGLKKIGENEWGDGQILDPSTGKIYRVKMTLKGNKLLVRGYLGISMLGRTQTWIR